VNTLRAAIWLLALCLAMPVHAARFEILNPDAHFPEGPIWRAGKLYYVEYDRKHRHRLGRQDQQDLRRAEGLRTLSGVRHHTGRFPHDVLRQRNHRSAVLRWHAAAGLGSRPGRQPIRRPERFRARSRGRNLFTTSGHPGKAIDGRVFYIASDGAITLTASDLNAANGLAVSLDGKTLYVIETEENRLLRFKIGPAGRLSDRRVFLNMDELTHHVGHIFPDGVKIDSVGESM